MSQSVKEYIDSLQPVLLMAQKLVPEDQAIQMMKSYELQQRNVAVVERAKEIFETVLQRELSGQEAHYIFTQIIGCNVQRMASIAMDMALDDKTGMTREQRSDEIIIRTINESLKLLNGVPNGQN